MSTSRTRTSRLTSLAVAGVLAVPAGAVALAAPAAAAPSATPSTGSTDAPDGEALTDDLAAKPYESLRPAELDELVAGLEPLAARLLAAQDS